MKKIKQLNPQKSGLQQLAVNISGGVANNSATFYLNDFVEIYNIVVSFAAYIYFPGVDGAAQVNSIFSSVVINGGISVLVNRESGLPFTTTYYLPGAYMFQIPIITNVIQIARVSSNPSVTIWYKNYNPL